MCINQAATLALVKTYPNRIIDKSHHEGYYNHYHLNNNTSYPHIWFYDSIVLEKERVRND